MCVLRYIIIAIVLLVIISLLVSPSSSSAPLRFKNKKVLYGYETILSSIGNPHVVVNQPGGFVIWYPQQLDKTSPYKSIILKDENKANGEFIYVSVDTVIEKTKLMSILAKYKNVYYEDQSGELIIRCDSLKCARDTLNGIFKIIGK